MLFQQENSYRKKPTRFEELQSFAEAMPNAEGKRDDALLKDIAPRLMLPTKSIDQWATLMHLNTVTMPTTTVSSLSTEYTLIDGVETLIFPVVYGDVRKTQSRGESTGTYATQLGQLLKSSGIYALASLASPLVSLVLMPFLTHNLGRDDYGAFAVLNTTIALLAGLTQFGLGNAFFRAYSCDYEDRRDRRAIVSTVLILLSMIAIPVALLAMLTAPLLSSVLLNTAKYADSVRLAALIVLLQNLTIPGLAWLRAENRALQYSLLSIANLLVNLVGAIVCVGLLHMGLNGAFVAVAGGYAIIVCCTLPVILLRTGLRIRRDIATNLLSFGLPLVSNFVSVWILQLSDRYLLSHFASLAQVASYSVAYSLGGLLGVVILSPFSLAWPSAMFAVAKRDDASRVYRTIFRWYSMLLLVSAFALSLASTVVFNVFFPPAYFSAAPVIPIVTLSILFYAVYNFFNTGVSIRRKTWFAVLFTTIAAVINIVFNLLLIPQFGALGAAESTLLAYIILTLVAYVVNQRIYPIPFEIDIFVVGLIAGIGLYVASSFLAQGHNMYEALGIATGAFVLFCLTLLLFSFIAVMRTKRNT